MSWYAPDHIEYTRERTKASMPSFHDVYALMRVNLGAAGRVAADVNLWTISWKNEREAWANHVCVYI